MVSKKTLVFSLLAGNEMIPERSLGFLVLCLCLASYLLFLAQNCDPGHTHWWNSGWGWEEASEGAGVWC